MLYAQQLLTDPPSPFHHSLASLHLRIPNLIASRSLFRSQRTKGSSTSGCVSHHVLSCSVPCRFACPNLLCIAQVDWECVPQYTPSRNPMVEVLRSKMYYGRARAMCVLPLFVSMKLHKLPSVVRSIFTNVKTILDERSDKGRLSAAKLAGSVLEMVIKEEVLCDPSYFSRVW